MKCLKALPALIFRNLERAFAFSLVVSLLFLLLAGGYFLYEQFNLLHCLINNDSCGEFLDSRTDLDEHQDSIDERYLGFASSLVTGSIALASLLISSFVTVLVSLLIFKAVTTRQLEIFEQNKEIARTNLLIDLENKILTLFEEKLGAEPLEQNHDEEDPLFEKAVYPHLEGYHNYRWAFREDPWDIFERYSDISLTKLHREINGLNMVLISTNGMRLSSKALHESLMWFRNVDRARSAGFIHESDLANLWRQTIPFVSNGRHQFLEKYFGRDDVKVVERVCDATLSAMMRLDTQLGHNIKLDGSFVKEKDYSPLFQKEPEYAS